MVSASIIELRHLDLDPAPYDSALSLLILVSVYLVFALSSIAYVCRVKKGRKGGSAQHHNTEVLTEQYLALYVPISFSDKLSNNFNALYCFINFIDM